jgi:clan AA aspartic protease (TIGR02281 family)
MARYRFDPEIPIIPLHVKLSNSQTRRIIMAFDTGATYTMVPWDVAEALGYKPSNSKKKIDIITASGIVEVPLVSVSRVSVLGKEANNVECVVHDLPEPSRVDGLLGLSFLRKFKIYLDFQNGILEIN